MWKSTERDTFAESILFGSIGKPALSGPNPCPVIPL